MEGFPPWVGFLRSPVKCGESVLFFIGGVIIEDVFGVDEIFWEDN